MHQLNKICQTFRYVDTEMEWETKSDVEIVKRIVINI